MSVSTEVNFKQDLPPKGGYKPINFKRIPTRSFPRGWVLFGGYLAMTACSGYLYYLNCKAVHCRELEMRCASLAIYPMLLAERDRAYLKQLRKNRDEETNLMANVEGWVTGTWYGEPIYRTVDPDTLIEPRFHEYYVHASYDDFQRRTDVSLNA